MGVSFRQHDDKKWEYRITYKDPITNKRKEASRRGFKTKAEAKHVSKEHEQTLLDGVIETKESLKQYLIDWLDTHRKDVVRKNTYLSDKNAVQKHILPFFKDITIDKYTPKKHQALIDHMDSQGYSKRTIEIVHSVMFNAMKKAVDLKQLKYNPCVGVTIKGRTKEKKLKFLDSSDISPFLKEAYKYDYIYWIFYKTIIETGMRKGEAAAIQWKDVDLNNGTISINKTLDFSAENEDELFGDTKTFKSNRVITISNGLINDLRFHRSYQNQNKLALNESYYHHLDLVLSRNDGNFLPKSTLFNSFSRILKKLDLPALPIHSLRHTHAVLQLEAGNSMKYIQERLGHGSMSITADVYSHVSKKIENESKANFENHLKEINY